MVNYFDRFDGDEGVAEPKDQAPQGDSVGGKLRNFVGEIWALPNTLVGLGYGYAGHAAGALAHKVGLRNKPPRIVRSPDKTEFVNNPFGGVSAITIGDTTTFDQDPYNGAYNYVQKEEGHSVFEHEAKHMVQGRQLGPLYLPSNLLGGLNALIHGEGWHGEHNWNERGPQQNPARPWAPRNGR